METLKKKKTARCNAVAKNIHLMHMYTDNETNKSTDILYVPLSFPHTLNLFICGFSCGYRQWRLKGSRFLGHLPGAVGSFRWICLSPTKPWALWLTSPFSSTGTGESSGRTGVCGMEMEVSSRFCFSLCSILCVSYSVWRPAWKTLFIYTVCQWDHSRTCWYSKETLICFYIDWGRLSRKLLLV